MTLAFDCDASAAERNATLGPLDIDYLYIHYCVFAGVPLASYAVLALWLCLLFFFLGCTADGYFSPTLASISEKLHVPYDVAGVTFLAFGNGAPDVFSSIAAYSSGVGEAGINELLGGAMFVSNVVVGCVAIASSVQVQRWAFSRDVAALMLALLLLLVLSTRSIEGNDQGDGTQLLFLSVYAAYVGTVVLPECLMRFRYRVKQEVRRSRDDSTRGVLSAFWHALSPRGSNKPVMSFPDEGTNGSSSAASYAFITRPDGVGSVELGSPKRKAETFPGAVIEDHFQDFSDSLTSPLISEDERTVVSEDDAEGANMDSPSWVRFSYGARVVESAYWRHLRWRWRMQRRIVQLSGGTESRLVKVISLPNILLVMARDLTVPLLDADTWSRSLASVSLVTVPQLVLWTTGDTNTKIGPDNTPLWVIVLAAGVIAGLTSSFTTHRSRAPDSLLACALFLLIAFVACVCWIYTVANELVALLVAVGTITHASNSLLGLTVLSWGNSVGDLITNVSVARAGFPEMAIAGCYGGPVFNILLGLGIPMTLAFFRGDPLQIELDDHAWISMGFLFFTLTLSYVVFRRHDYFCPSWYGKTLVAFYSVYTVLNIILALKHSQETS
ncbi:hypothetical protein Poli38472_005586 [Pythium oligandrum]|uniref:Sodium/calcium exchanger membrane region domain-containing protein n=1 Tax=Pythium oligandrum TaxID=41045 RepID=A0A8K1FLS1_PYTOL|nr:hypothetical protein Poli38472_005586 [Pythium oligandrum]|eukprot:TMW62968.1 hypothetical protein Poli38472_005586 [Pythium oligandrum]